MTFFLLNFSERNGIQYTSLTGSAIKSNHDNRHYFPPVFVSITIQYRNDNLFLEFMNTIQHNWKIRSRENHKDNILLTL